MKSIRLYHPIWTHLPALLLSAASAIVLARAAALPGPWPIHWNAAGQPDNFGRVWWEFPVGMFVAVLMMLAISVAIDGLWAQSENGRKRFNPICVIDELVLAIVFGSSLSYAGWLRHEPRSLWDAPTPIVGLVAVLLALALEWLRPAGTGKHA